MTGSDRERHAKRRKLDTAEGSKTESDALSVTATNTVSLHRAISPPPVSRRTPVPFNHRKREIPPAAWDEDTLTTFVPSPIRLMRIRDLPASANTDTVGLSNILGDPLIRECWQFNYLFDVDFLMNHLDIDVRHAVQVKIVHGSWKKEDPHRISIEEQSERWPNVQLITAHMPEPFGTHHCKMMVLVRHDDTAEVIIHTANMIHQDWTNMSQAIWRSDALPLLQGQVDSAQPEAAPVGSGQRFKLDLLRYLDAYQSRLRKLTEQLQRYDFTSIRAAFIASVPGKQSTIPAYTVPGATPWGWPGLREILRTIPCPASEAAPQVHIQVSSIATLTSNWFDSFFQTLGLSSTKDASHTQADDKARSFFSPARPAIKPVIRIVFPTAAEIRDSLDGYRSGDSIHMKFQSSAQVKQLHYMKPLLCRWSSNAHSTSNPTGALTSPSPAHASEEIRETSRRRAAPHIKTYIRFSDARCTRIDWAMITSANLSKQAWGEQASVDREVRICSWEVGVVVWPDLFAGEGEETVMVPTFETDMPARAEVARLSLAKPREERLADGATREEKRRNIVGLRMPYDLPLIPYDKDDLPWCAAATHLEPDWKGVVWEGYFPKV